MQQSELDFISNLRQSSPYIAAHRGKIIVIYLPGEIIGLPEQLIQFAKDIVLLNNLGLKVVLALGASQQIDQALTNADLSWENHQNCRITTEAHLEVFQQTIGIVRSKLEAAFTQACAEQHSTLTIVSGNWVVAKPKGIIDGIDYQHTGSLRRIDQQAINDLLDRNQVTLLTPLAYSLSGEVFNMNTLEQAFAVSKAIVADKLMIFTKHSVLESLPKSLSQIDVNNLIEDTTHPAHTLLSQIKEIQPEVKRIHFMDQQQPSSILLELFSREGAGTLIYNDKYHQVRQATIEDVAGIIRLISPLEEQGMLVKRSRESLELEINHFVVAEVDQQIIGCAALYPFETNTAELACLAVDDHYQGSDIGQELLKYIENLAKQQSIQTLFSLTTHAQHWFQEQGFEPMAVDQLPAGKQKLYNWQRQSKILQKEL